MNNHLYSAHTYCPDYCDCQGLPKFLRVWHDKYCHYSLAAIKLSSNKNKLRLYFLHCHVTKISPHNCHMTRSNLLSWQLSQSGDKITLTVLTTVEWPDHPVLTTVKWQDHIYCPDNCHMTRSFLLSWQLLPVNPGGHSHIPETWSHGLSSSHRHTSIQSLP